MAASNRPWLIGCALGCGLLVVVVGIALVAASLFVGDFVVQVRQVEDSGRLLEQRHGRVEDFRPHPSGRLDASRLQTFLEVRAALQPQRRELEGTLGTLSQAETEGLAATEEGVLGVMKSGADLLPAIFRFSAERTDALLQAEMGPGEYLYLYNLCFYAYLGHSPGDGPPFTLSGGPEEQDGQEPADAFAVREARLERLTRRLNRRLRPVLEGQLAEARDAAVDAEWLRTLEQEVARLRDDPLALPWQRGLPAAMQADLQPFRERLEDAYSPLCNPLDAGAGP